MRYGLLFTTFILFFVLQPFLFGETKERSPLDQLLTLYENSDIRVEEWQLHTRGPLNEHMDRKLLEKEIEQLTESLPSFDWEKCANDEREGLYMIGKRTYNHLPLEETLSIYSYPSRQHSNLIYVSYSMVATPKDIHSLEYNELEQIWNETVETIFRKQPTVYTTVKGKDKGTINLNERAQQLLEALQAHPIEQINEPTFVSITAYNEEWPSELITRGEKFNVQIGMRQEPILGLDTTVTIGTPIITTEY